MRSKTLMILGFTFLANRALAGEGGSDAREQCRALVSGTYLSYMNDLDVLKSNLTVSQESGFSLKARKGLAVKELKALEEKSEAAKIPAAELDETILGTKASIDSTNQAIEDTDVRIAEVKHQIAEKEKGFRSFQVKLKPVFQITNAKIVLQGAYPIKLEYRHPCSDYNRLCPLPKPMAEALVELAKELEDGTACTRYANMR